ncbi:MAG: radical SAM protein [Phycisphaerae bacterium]
MPADITLVNLNMLFMRYGQEIERELHVPLGCLYLTTSLEKAGFAVDFRDYQLCPSDEPFDMPVFMDYMKEPAKVIGLSCMANLLPFSILAAKALKERYPDRTIVLGGVGSKSVEDKILKRFPWIDIICRGEGELTAVDMLGALRDGRDLATVKGISLRKGKTILHNPDRPRIDDLDAIGFPAWEKVDLKRYAGYGMMTSRGCPYHCTFCSVAPVWNLESRSRSAKNIVEEMRILNKNAGVKLFLFQDEFFVSGKKQVMEFCRELVRSELGVEWKAFGRVNLMDEEMMHAMADCGCLELRFGIESGSDKILKIIKKGFKAAQSLAIVPKAVEIFPRVDTFFVWGFPFETMDDFNQSLFQMVSFRMMGARILPSLLSLLPQTEVYRQLIGKVTLEFCPFLLPEFVFTGHEIARGGEVEIPDRYKEYFQIIMDNPDIFPGFFHVDLANNVFPKLQLLRKFGFYPEAQPIPVKMAQPDASQGGAATQGASEASADAAPAVTGPPPAFKPDGTPNPQRIEPQELATRAGKG